MADLAQVVINSAKVEVDYIRATDAKGSGFIPDAPELEHKPSTTPGVLGTTVHRLRG